MFTRLRLEKHYLTTNGNLPLRNSSLTRAGNLDGPLAIIWRLCCTRRNSTRKLQLQLLNYFVRALDASLLAVGANPADQASPNQQWSPLGGGALESRQQPQGAGRQPSFGSMRLQFELTLELLKQVLKSSAAPARRRSAQVGLPVDSRPLLLLVGEYGISCKSQLSLHRCGCCCRCERKSVQGTAHTMRQARGTSTNLSNQTASEYAAAAAEHNHHDVRLRAALHRRLLEQVGQLRQELPPICRLIAPSSGASSQPLDRSLSSPSHRTLADLEERLCLTISQQSIGRFAESLADPLLKLEEFLLVFELVNDLVSFVGQKCKQSYSLRGKQLLNELTPVTGCPSLSSSEEELDEDETFADTTGLANEDDYQDERLPGSFAADGTNQGSFGGYNSLGGSTLALAMQGNPSGQAKRSSQQHLDRPHSRQQAYNLPTSINVTAPSPMGSTRDVSRFQMADASPDEPQIFPTIGCANPSNATAAASMKRHSHQDVLSSDQLVSKTNQMRIGPSASSSRRSIAGNIFVDQTSVRAKPRQCDSSDNLNTTMGSIKVDSASRQQARNGAHSLQDGAAEDDDEPQQDDNSRSKLIDELLKTINDDSFNEFIDFNNKLIAATKSSGSTSSQPDQMDSNGGQLADLVNANRPKSAMGGGDGGTRFAMTTSSSSQMGGSARPPRTLNLGAGGGSSAQANKSSGGYGAHQRGSICVTSSNQQQPSTFDNVIRRMSTNFVQNFNKMSAGTLGASTGDALGGASNETLAANTTLRREKSSTTTYSNSLYVDNQVPARRHSDNTINVPRIQVALSSPSSSGSRTNLNQRASQSATKLATKWKLTAKTNQREASDKLSPNLGGALGYIRRHSSGNTQGAEKGGSNSHDQNQSNGLGAQLLNASPFKTRSNSNLGIDFLMSNRSMKRRYSAASMLGHQTQRKAEDLIDAGMKSVQNMFS